MISLPRPDLKFCYGCQRDRPLTEFRRRHKGGTERLPQCRECHNQAERDRKQRKRERAERAEFRKQLTKLNQAEPKALNDLCAGILERFGGVEGVLHSLTETHARAKPGSPARLRAVMAMLKIVQTAADAETKRHTQFQKDVSRMSDEELEHAMKERLQAMVEGDPSLAIEAAMEVGWRVVPPTGEVAQT